MPAIAEGLRNYGSIEKKHQGTEKGKVSRDLGTVQSSSCILLAAWWGTRHIFVLLAFLGCANIYAMRVNLSVAIVAMVGKTS